MYGLGVNGRGTTGGFGSEVVGQCHRILMQLGIGVIGTGGLMVGIEHRAIGGNLILPLNFANLALLVRKIKAVEKSSFDGVLKSDNSRLPLKTDNGG